MLLNFSWRSSLSCSLSANSCSSAWTFFSASSALKSALFKLAIANNNELELGQLFTPCFSLEPKIIILILYSVVVACNFTSVFSTFSSKFFTRISRERTSWSFAVCSSSCCLILASYSSARAVAASASARRVESF